MYLPTTHTSAPVQLPSSSGYADVPRIPKWRTSAAGIGLSISMCVHNATIRANPS